MVYRVAQGSILSYRALFTWLNPLGYLSSRIIRPIGLAITFGAVSAHFGARLSWTLTGASLLAGVHAVVFGMALAVGNERSFGTLDIWLASPQNKIAAICQRALPHIADGFIGGTITYLACCGLFRIAPMPIYRFAALLLFALASAFGFGMVVGGAAMVIKDIFVTPNMAYLVITVLSGALVPISKLPRFIQPMAIICPVSHIARYAVSVRSGASSLMLAGCEELGVGLLWFVLGSLIIRHALIRARRS
jgi:ABC-2 type transport system permease protein